MSFFAKCNTVRYMRKKAQEVLLRLIFTAFLRINSRHFSILKQLHLGGPNGELGASLRYLSQRYSMPDEVTKGLLTDIGTEELAHLEIVGSIVRQLVRNATTEEIENSPFAQYFMNHGRGVYPADSSGVPFDANCLAVSADPITDLAEDLAADAATA